MGLYSFFISIIILAFVNISLAQVTINGQDLKELVAKQKEIKRMEEKINYLENELLKCRNNVEIKQPKNTDFSPTNDKLGGKKAIIVLKNGCIINTDSYWEEGSFVNYEQLGTIIKINKDSISKIQE